MGIKVDFQIPGPVAFALNSLNNAGYEAYIVGGAVRNTVMGLPVHDYDLTTSALPEEIKNVFSDCRIIETGIKHGTVTILIDGEALEITTYRIDGEYTDKRRPDEVSFTSELESDLARRDFTCNALAYNPDEGLIDYFGGIDDIYKGIIRCVGDPEKRFGEDALRIMRAIRFSSVLGFEIDKKTSDSVHALRNLLKFVSEERLFSELKLLLCGKDAGRILREYSDVIFTVIPDFSPMYGCGQNHPRHIYDVWGHTVASVENIRPDPELRLAMLLHDCGKPSVKSTDEKGVDHFYGHAEKSTEIADSILLAFKTSNRLRKHVVTLVRYHGFTPDKMTEKTYKKYIGKFGLQTVKELFEIRDADSRAQNPSFIEQSLAENRIGLEILDRILQKEACFGLKDLDIDGSDLIEAGFTSSPLLGKVLSDLLEEVMDNKINNNKAELLERAKEYLQ